MLANALPPHPGLRHGSRLPVLVQGHAARPAFELAALMLLGASAALAVALVEFKLRIPGHAIVRAIFPMALGLALAPRRRAGCVMGASAGVTALLLQAAGAGKGLGAMTSLCMTGPCLDLALWGADRGWRLYLGFGLAGLLSNLIAFGVQAASKLSGLSQGGGRRFAEWWPQALGTYAACGVLAGVISAAIWFRLRPTARERGVPE